jgi:hypothetical protein
LPATGRIVVNESNPTSLANTVWLTGSPESFARTNPGFTAPAAEFFVPVPRR